MPADLFTHPDVLLHTSRLDINPDLENQDPHNSRW
jgi:hypothetical protein